jgi:hypothetical protein
MHETSTEQTLGTEIYKPFMILYLFSEDNFNVISKY